MAIGSPQKTPTQRRRRGRIKTAVAAAIALLFVFFTGVGRVFDTAVYPLILVLMAACTLQANEARNGRE
jgi:hypothetical protein